MINNDIVIPAYWDEKKVLEAFKTKSTLELYKFFECNNAMAFSRKMKPVFPNKPDKVPYSEYAREILASIDPPKKLSFAELQALKREEAKYIG